MSITKDQIIEAVASMSVMEVVELIKLWKRSSVFLLLLP
ncbi:hypothetical protein ACNKHX_24710 [Shigella flexneri]